MHHRSTVLTTTLEATLAALIALLGGCDATAPGAAAYEAGRFDEALVLFRAAGGARPTPVLLYDTALAALRAGDIESAHRAIADALATGESDIHIVAPTTFLAGNVAYARAELAGAQADAPESEPFAFDVALGLAEEARAHWESAAALRSGDWPEAGRNVARANTLIDDLMAKRSAAEDRKRRREAGGPPKIRLNPVATGDKPPEAGAEGTDPPLPEPPDATGTGTDAEDSAATASGGPELPAADVRRLLDTLAEKEREKQTLRRTRRDATRGGVERDW